MKTGLVLQWKCQAFSLDHQGIFLSVCISAIHTISMPFTNIFGHVRFFAIILSVRRIPKINIIKVQII